MGGSPHLAQTRDTWRAQQRVRCTKREHQICGSPFSFRSSVYSRHKCCICCPSPVSRVWKYCSRSASFKPASEYNLDNFWPSDNCLNFRSYSCRKFHHCRSLVECSTLERTAGISTFSKCRGAASFPGALVRLGTSSHKSAVAPQILS